MAANTNFLSLSDIDRQQLETWLADFDATWNEHRLKDCLAAHTPPGHPLRLLFLGEMVKVDLQKHSSLGRRPRVEGYLSTYPELGTPDTVAAELLVAEYQGRRRLGDPVTLDDYA
jgi:hypothetical protein